MPWQLEVTYRGVPFFVEASDDEFTRRGAHHQYPFKSKGIYEDLGAEDAVYNLSGYVTEHSPGGYAAARDKLLEACTSGGIGDLNHPYYGKKRVQCLACRVSHTDRENGVARFALTFLEAEEPGAIVEVEDGAAKVSAAADAAQEATVNAFARMWDVAGAPGFVYEAAQDLVEDVGAAIDELAGPLPEIISAGEKFLGGTAKLLGVGREALDDPKLFLTRQARGLGGLINNALSLGVRIAGLGRTLSLLAKDASAAHATQQRVSATGTAQSPTGQIWSAVPGKTANRGKQAENQDALQTLMQRNGVIEAARQCPYMPFQSREEAVAVRDSLTEQLDALANRAPEDVYCALEALRVAVVADITRRGPELGRIGAYTPHDTRPALCVAYEVYDTAGADGALATEICNRNTLMHPGFVTGGKPLEVKLDV